MGVGLLPFGVGLEVGVAMGLLVDKAVFTFGPENIKNIISNKKFD